MYFILMSIHTLFFAGKGAFWGGLEFENSLSLSSNYLSVNK